MCSQIHPGKELSHYSIFRLSGDFYIRIEIGHWKEKKWRRKQKYPQEAPELIPSAIPAALS